MKKLTVDDVSTEDINSGSKQKPIHARINANVRDAINAIVKDRGLKTQNEAIELAIQALNLGSASEILPEKEQAVAEITNLFRRIITIITDSFYVISDAKADFEGKANELRNDYAQEITCLKTENEKLKQKVSDFEQIFAIMGQNKDHNQLPCAEEEDHPGQKSIPSEQNDEDNV